MRNTVLLALLLAPSLSALSAPAPHPTPQQTGQVDVWTERAFGNAAPQFARSYSFIAYDSARQELVRFGGYNGSQGRPGTWTWDGGTWTKHTPGQEPPARYAYGNLVYDELREKAVLFGGDGGPVSFDDTWEWDGFDWTEVIPATRPPARVNHGIVYDRARAEVLVFGGYDDSGKALADFWSYDGSDWTELTPANLPTQRFGHQMTYDAVRERVVLFGGARGNIHLDDTWEWDGLDWVELFPATRPAPRGLGGFTFDASHGKALLFGGWDAAGWRSDLWAWDGNDWSFQKIKGRPTPRCCPGFVYDGARGRVVLFGGCDNSVVNDTWELYEGALAVFDALAPAAHGPALDVTAGSLPWIGEGFEIAVAGASGAYAIGLVGSSMAPHDLGSGEPGPRALGYRLMLTGILAEALLPVTNGVATWSIAVPPDPNLLGSRFHLQAIVQTLEGDVAYSNPCTATLGAR